MDDPMKKRTARFYLLWAKHFVRLAFFDLVVWVLLLGSAGYLAHYFLTRP
jgi:hypothetical protein